MITLIRTARYTGGCNFYCLVKDEKRYDFSLSYTDCANMSEKCKQLGIGYIEPFFIGTIGAREYKKGMISIDELKEYILSLNK